MSALIPVNPVTLVRTGQVPAAMERMEFGTRFRAAYAHDAFRAEDAAIAKLEAIAWEGYITNRKSLATQHAGIGYADPEYAISTE